MIQRKGNAVLKLQTGFGDDDCRLGDVGTVRHDIGDVIRNIRREQKQQEGGYQRPC